MLPPLLPPIPTVAVRERQRGIKKNWFLASLEFAGQAGRMKTKGRLAFAAQVQRQSRGRIPSFWGDFCFSLFRQSPSLSCIQLIGCSPPTIWSVTLTQSTASTMNPILGTSLQHRLDGCSIKCLGTMVLPSRHIKYEPLIITMVKS